ncbi:MAG: TetR/AcrR family transcriptional regulator [Lachnospiraceae bacterium]|jgi:AcrR family transcriptional regulator|nr:TetR/AcrR family transcriptional regulator [Lachnospiraceae bacterium]
MNKGIVSKKEILFQSIWKLHMEGTDWGSIRMGAVAAASGIPKGTIYEHFRSKDQLIAETIIWSLKKEAEEIYRKMAEASGFAAMLDVVFEWVGSPQGRVLFLMWFMDKGKFPESLKKELYNFGRRDCEGLDTAERVTEALIRSGFQDGALETEGGRLARQTALYSALAPVIAYSMFPNRYEGISWEEVKSYSQWIFTGAFRKNKETGRV